MLPSPLYKKLFFLFCVCLNTSDIEYFSFLTLNLLLWILCPLPKWSGKVPTGWKSRGYLWGCDSVTWQLCHPSTSVPQLPHRNTEGSHACFGGGIEIRKCGLWYPWKHKHDIVWLFLAVWPWAGSLTSLCFGFSTVKWG